VFYMAGRQLALLSRRLLDAGWPADAPVCVVSRAGWPDQLASDHALSNLAQAGMLHRGRPTVVTIGAGARTLASAGKALPEMAVPAPAPTAAP
jgi:uroporphyrin-III C-methyltransferase